MKRAFSPTEVITMKKRVFNFENEFYEAFETPETCGVWFIWGNSGNGKTSFVMQLAKELCKHAKVCYNSLEEGCSLTMRNALSRYEMTDVNKRFQLLDCEPMSDLVTRLKSKRSADVAIIDSFQYSQLTYKQYIELKQELKHKLLIFISHADGKQPAGRSAKSVMYDASLKIWVEGYRAMSKGRFIGPNGGTFTIWDDGAQRYWGDKNL